MKTNISQSYPRLKSPKSLPDFAMTQQGLRKRAWQMHLDAMPPQKLPAIATNFGLMWTLFVVVCCLMSMVAE